MITINIKTNPGLYEACKIVNRKDKRKYIQVLHVKNGIYFATNSGTMLFGDTNLGEGQYFVMKSTKSTVELLKNDETFSETWIFLLDNWKGYN